MDLEEIEKFNPWWRTGTVKEDWLKPYKRKIYFELLKYINKRQVLLIQGLRRMGKTTLMFQLIQELLSKTQPKNILYFSFDEIAFDLKEVMETYQRQVLGRAFDESKERIYLFLDEIQKVDDWENKIKVYYDLYPNLKFIISGSASVSLRKKAKESLAGRVFDFTAEPLSFEEFLELKGEDVRKIKEKPEIWKRRIIPLFHTYLKFGTFPELVNEEDEEAAKKYIINNVVERIIYKDLPEEFKIKDLELLKNLVFLLGKNPGVLLNYKEIAKNLGRDQRTISNYFEYLQFSFLIKFVFNYRGSPLASLRKLKKVYFVTPNIPFALNEKTERIMPALLENLVLLKTNAKFFYKDGYEIDFVLVEDGRVIPIEVKSESIKLKQLRRFIQKFGRKVKKAFIVDFEKEEKIDGIYVVPAWKLLLFGIN
ncbi:MAG: ATP-binding protein [Candidatus Micrarchaeia archaeon]